MDAAAPLLCAGITLYSPLRHWNAGPDKKIAVIGLGGLGHVGVKLAKAMGAHVTVLSQSLKKMEDGLRLGADEYYATSDPATFEKLAGRFDLILNTVSANLDLNAYLGLLALDGTLVELGMPEHPMEVPAGALIMGRRSLSGSLIGGIAETQEMLDFCAEHGVAPRNRGHSTRLHQRGLRASPGQRRALPVRHRHRSAARRISQSSRVSSATPASGQPAAASVAATRLTFSGPASW